MANRINLKPNDSGIYKIDLSMFPDKITYNEEGMEIEVSIDVPFEKCSQLPKDFKIHIPPLNLEGTELEKVVNIIR